MNDVSKTTCVKDTNSIRSNHQQTLKTTTKMTTTTIERHQICLIISSHSVFLHNPYHFHKRKSYHNEPFSIIDIVATFAPHHSQKHAGDSPRPHIQTTKAGTAITSDMNDKNDSINIHQLLRHN